jgi:hypothetical protein
MFIIRSRNTRSYAYRSDKLSHFTPILFRHLRHAEEYMQTNGFDKNRWVIVQVDLP